MTLHYGDNCVGQRKVCELVEIFRRGKTSAENGRSGWPHNVTRVGVKKLHQRIRETPKTNNDETESGICVCHKHNK